jgi:hypothetical protein
MTFDRKTIWIAVSVFAVLVLAVANWAATENPTWPTEWHELVTCEPSGKPDMFYYFDSGFDELPPLDLASLHGRVKFISFALPAWEKCPIGYVIDLDALPIPKDKEPEKYQKGFTFDSPSGPLTNPPLDEANYVAHFVFHLIDADGFEIATVNSPKHHVRSGEAKRIQSQTEPAVTMAQANRLDKVMVEMSVDKCLNVVD